MKEKNTLIHIHAESWDACCEIQSKILTMIDQSKKCALFTDEIGYTVKLKQKLKEDIPQKYNRQKIEDGLLVTLDRSLQSIIVHHRQILKEKKWKYIFCAFINKVVRQKSLLELQQETGSTIILFDPYQEFTPPVTSVSISNLTTNINNILTNILK